MVESSDIIYKRVVDNLLSFPESPSLCFESSDIIYKRVVDNLLSFPESPSLCL
jgi:hypothetical protein